ELRDDFGDHALDVVDDRRVRRLRLAHPPLEHAAQPFGGAGVALEVERGGVLQVPGRDRTRRPLHASASHWNADHRLELGDGGVGIADLYGAHAHGTRRLQVDAEIVEINAAL